MVHGLIFTILACSSLGGPLYWQEYSIVQRKNSSVLRTLLGSQFVVFSNTKTARRWHPLDAAATETTAGQLGSRRLAIARVQSGSLVEVVHRLVPGPTVGLCASLGVGAGEGWPQERKTSRFLATGVGWGASVLRVLEPHGAHVGKGRGYGEWGAGHGGGSGGCSRYGAYGEYRRNGWMGCACCGLSDEFSGRGDAGDVAVIVIWPTPVGGFRRPRRRVVKGTRFPVCICGGSRP